MLKTLNSEIVYPFISRPRNPYAGQQHNCLAVPHPSPDPPHRKVLGRAWEKKKEKEGVGRGLKGNDTNLLLKCPGNELFGAF